MFRRYFLISSLLAVAACSGPQGAFSLAPNSTLIVVRHADRDGEDLSAKGKIRSRDLVHALNGMPLDAIISPGIKRNMDTAAPLATARNLPVQNLPSEMPTSGLIAASAGRSVIWIGNKGNLKAIWKDLRLSNPPPLEYGDLHIIRADAGGAVSIERRHFGG